MVAGSWKQLVFGEDGLLDRTAYTLCILEALCGALRKREMYALSGRRWNEPRARLLSGSAWEAQRTSVCRGLGLTPEPAPTLAALGRAVNNYTQLGLFGPFEKREREINTYHYYKCA